MKRLANALGLVVAGAIIGASLLLGRRYALVPVQHDVAWRVDSLTGETCRIWFSESEWRLFKACGLGEMPSGN